MNALVRCPCCGHMTLSLADVARIPMGPLSNNQRVLVRMLVEHHPNPVSSKELFNELFRGTKNNTSYIHNFHVQMGMLRKKLAEMGWEIHNLTEGQRVAHYILRQLNQEGNEAQE